MIDISTKLKLFVDTPPNIIIGRPNTNPMLLCLYIHRLHLLVPMILPMMISNSPFLAEVIAITNSGVLVPTTNITIVISFSLICRYLAMATQLSTARLLPNDIATRPQMEIIIDTGRFHFGFS